jgi:hypothetical protein
MEISAAGINRKINENLAAAASRDRRTGYPGGSELLYSPMMSLERPVTADDLDLSFHLTAHFWHANPFNGTKAQAEAYRILQEAFE